MLYSVLVLCFLPLSVSHSVHRILYSIQYVHCIYCTVYSMSTVYTVQYTVCPLYILYSIQYVHCMYTVQYIQYIQFIQCIPILAPPLTSQGLEHGSYKPTILVFQMNSVMVFVI